MHTCNKCKCDFENLQCPECGQLPNEAEDWVTQEELDNWRERVDYFRTNEQIMIQQDHIRSSLSAVFEDCEPLDIRDVPDALEAINSELLFLEGDMMLGFYRNLYDAKMIINEAIENGY